MTVAAAMLLLPASSAFSRMLIQEDFNYLPGSVNGVATNATGLTGNWVAGANGGSSSASSSFASVSLTLAGHFAPSGGSLEITNGGPSYGEGGASAGISADLTGSTFLFASSIMQFASPSGSYFNDWAVEQRFNTGASGGYGSSSGRNLVRAYGSGSNANGNGGVSADASEVTQGIGTSAPDTNYLLVTRYTVSGTDITKAELFAFDSTAYGNLLANANPGNADALLGAYASYTLTDTATRSLGDFDFLQFNINGGPIGRYDDFRMGTEATDVVNVVPEPSSALLVLAGFLPLLYRRRAQEHAIDCGS